MGSERPHQLTSVGELVFMAPPTLACDGPQEDSIDCGQVTQSPAQQVGGHSKVLVWWTKLVPVLFVAMTINVAALGKERKVEEEMVGLDITTIMPPRAPPPPGHGGSLGAPAAVPQDSSSFCIQSTRNPKGTKWFSFSLLPLCPSRFHSVSLVFTLCLSRFHSLSLSLSFSLSLCLSRFHSLSLSFSLSVSRSPSLFVSLVLTL